MKADFCSRNIAKMFCQKNLFQQLEHPTQNSSLWRWSHCFHPTSQWKDLSWHRSAVCRRDDDSFLRVQIAFVLQMKTLLPWQSQHPLHQPGKARSMENGNMLLWHRWQNNKFGRVYSSRMKNPGQLLGTKGMYLVAHKQQHYKADICLTNARYFFTSW